MTSAATRGPGAGPADPSLWSLIPRRLRPRVRCCAHRTDGSPCRAWAMHGQRVCWSHGGASRQARAAAQLRLEAASADVHLARFERAARAAEAKRAAEARRLLGLAPGAELRYGDWLAVGAIRAHQQDRAMAAERARMEQRMRVLDDLEDALLREQEREA